MTLYKTAFLGLLRRRSIWMSLDFILLWFILCLTLFFIDRVNPQHNLRFVYGLGFAGPFLLGLYSGAYFREHFFSHFRNLVPQYRTVHLRTGCMFLLFVSIVTALMAWPFWVPELNFTLCLLLTLVYLWSGFALGVYQTIVSQILAGCFAGFGLSFGIIYAAELKALSGEPLRFLLFTMPVFLFLLAWHHLLARDPDYVHFSRNWTSMWETANIRESSGVLARINRLPDLLFTPQVHTVSGSSLFRRVRRLQSGMMYNTGACLGWLLLTPVFFMSGNIKVIAMYLFIYSFLIFATAMDTGRQITQKKWCEHIGCMLLSSERRKTFFRDLCLAWLVRLIQIWIVYFGILIGTMFLFQLHPGYREALIRIIICVNLPAFILMFSLYFLVSLYSRTAAAITCVILFSALIGTGIGGGWFHVGWLYQGLFGIMMTSTALLASAAARKRWASADLG